MPLLVLVIVFFDLPLAATTILSLLHPVTDQLSLVNYAGFFGSPTYLLVAWRTLKIAMIVALCCALVGYPLSYWTVGLPVRARRLVLGIVITSFWLSVLVRTYAWIVLLGNAGVVNRLLLQVHWIDKPVSFLYNELGVVIGMVNVLLPFMVLPLYAAMAKVDPRLEPMALTLGASRMQFFCRVFWPLTRPTLLATLILVFILSLGFYITPAILGGGRVPLISNMLDMLINQFPNWSLAAAISVTLLAFTLGLFFVYQRMRNRAAL